MKTKIVDIACAIDGCKLQTSAVIIIGQPCEPFELFKHEGRQGRCLGSGLTITLDYTMLRVRIISSVGGHALLEVDREG